MRTTALFSLAAMPLRTVLFAAAFAGSLSLSKAALINADFESGTTGWAESGGTGNFVTTTAVTGLYGSVLPAGGLSFGVVSNDGVAADVLSQSFTVPAGSSYLSITYRFLTDSLNDPAFNDTASAVLSPGVGSPLTLFAVSRNDLQAGGDGPLLAGAQYFDFQTIAQDGWRTSVTNISSLAGQTVTLSFNVNNGGDADALLQSSLALDNISLSSVPEPGSAGLLAGVLTVAALRRRRGESV